MAFFGTPNAFLGLDIGSSSLKLVELVNRRRRVEVATYAQADLPNLLMNPQNDENSAVNRTADAIAAMLDKAGTGTDAVIAALPNSVVFSTVLTLPSLPEKEVDKAVHFAARDVVPADLDEMVVGWSRLGETPHMDTDEVAKLPMGAEALREGGLPVFSSSSASVPVFVTAAPKDVVGRYVKVMQILKLQLYALEVETFPLVRSLFENPLTATGLIVDIGDRATTLHIIDNGTPRVSHTLEYGGHTITARIAENLKISPEAAEADKVAHGLSSSASPELRRAIEDALATLIDQARNLSELYAAQNSKTIARTILIGGGANLKNLAPTWQAALNHPTSIGNPWRGLSYPDALGNRLQLLGPTFAVAVGLAERGVRSVQ